LRKRTFSGNASGSQPHLSFTGPPCGRRVTGRNLVGPQRDEVAALIRVAANLGTILAAQIAFQFVNGRRLRPADDVQRDGLVSVAAKAADFEIEVAGIERVA
jgi:hypothetical protein